MLFGPLRRMTPSAPMPGAVASATMVSSQPVSFPSILANIVDSTQLTVDSTLDKEKPGMNPGLSQKFRYPISYSHTLILPYSHTPILSYSHTCYCDSSLK